ncbi:hypothetical protein BGZ57DRAFT_900702 [Hyaloscypha finlandica]|nr:hypothetical protein BGZ57DRAFT_900702 [Hyaloscypha finlandica]
MSTPTALPSQSTREKVVAISSQPASSRASNATPKWVDTLLFWVDWGIKVLGVAAAVIFGIWAPLSYQAANNGDAATSSMISAAFAANSQASSALSIQSTAAAKQSVALDALNSRIGAIGQLWLLDFCLGNTALAACKSFTSELPITSLVSYLASPTIQASTTFSQTATQTSTTTPTPSSGSAASRTALSIPAILGIVFAIILFLGVIAGIFVSRLKRLRNRQYEE